MYFHQCHNGGSDLGGLSCDVNAYSSQMSLGGNPGSGTYVFGDIIVDQLNMSGNPSITMDINTQSWAMRASLVQ